MKLPSLKKISLLAALFAGALGLATAQAQPMTFTGSYSQNFDAMGTTGTTLPPGFLSMVIAGNTGTFTAAKPVTAASIASATADTQTLLVWNAGSKSISTGTQSLNIGCWDSLSDRALGTDPASTGAQVIQLSMTNNTGGTLYGVTFSYDCKCLTNGTPQGSYTNTTEESELPGYCFFYSTTDTNTATSWTEIGVAGNAALVNGVPVQNGLCLPNFTQGTTMSSGPVTIIFATPLTNNGVMYFRWADDNNTADNPDQMLAIDNISITSYVPGAPQASINSPANNASFTPGSSIPITASASESGGTITNVEFYANSTDLGSATSAPYSLAWTNVPVGNYALSVVASDALGLSITSFVVSVTVAYVPPTISMTSPANNTVFGAPASISLSAAPSDSGGTVTNVAFYQGSSLLANTSADPYTFIWSNVPAGTYALTAQATDNNGSTGTSSPVTVTVLASPVTSFTGSYTQNFDAMGTSGTTLPPGFLSMVIAGVNNTYTASSPITAAGIASATPDSQTLLVWNAGSAPISTGTQSFNIGGWDSPTDRALGSNPASTAAQVIQLSMTNNTGGTLYGVTFSYDCKCLTNGVIQSGGSSPTEKSELPGYCFFYSTTDPSSGANWTEVGVAGTAALSNGIPVQNGLCLPNFTQGTTMSSGPVNITFATPLANNGVMYFRWADDNNIGDNPDQMLAIDNISITTYNPGPLVSIASPANNANFLPGSSIPVTTSALGTGSTITNVEFYANSTDLGSATSAPYSLIWSSVPAGNYTLSAVATDNTGLAATSSVVNITVAVPLPLPTITLNFPTNGQNDMVNPASLKVTVSDPEGTNLSVVFYGRVASPPAGPDFTIVALPDTQYYNGALSSIYQSQTDWVIANRTNLNIVYVSSLGDIVNDGDAKPSEWLSATNALYRLDDPVLTGLSNGIPYGMVPGNHDHNNAVGGTVLYNTYFGVDHFINRPWYGGHLGNDNQNHYDLLSFSGLDFVFVFIDFDYTYIDYSAIDPWSESVLQAYPNRRAIVVSHDILAANGGFDPRGQAIYDNLKANNNLFLMLCGHNQGQYYRSDTNGTHVIASCLSDYQDFPNGGGGYLRTYQFSPSNNVIHVNTYSPYYAQNLGTNFNNSPSQFDIPYNMTQTTAFTVIGTVSSVPSGRVVSMTWPGLTTNTTYEWYATVTDGQNTTNIALSQFTTGTNLTSSPLTVTLSGPVNGSSFAAPAMIALSATASDTDGNVTNVAFYQGTTLLANVTSAPYTFTTANLFAGTYALTAVATDDSGASTTSSAVNVTVTNTVALTVLQSIKTVFVIAMENHDLVQKNPTGSPQQILGNPAAPYFNSLITPGNPNAVQTAWATHMFSCAINGEHPSEPNYIWQEAGTDFGVRTDNDPSVSSHNLYSNVMHLSGQLTAAGIPWRNYQEDVEYSTSPLKSASGSGKPANPYNGTTQYNYGVKHNPMAFFTDTQNINVYPMTNFWTDLGNNNVGRYNWITPDQYNEWHSALNGTYTYHGIAFTGDQSAIASGDNCLSIIIPRIMASAAYQDHGVIIIWTDETESTDDTNTTLPYVIISPMAKGNAYASTLPYSHASDLKTMDEIFGLAYQTNAIPTNGTGLGYYDAQNDGNYDYVDGHSATVYDLSDFFQGVHVPPVARPAYYTRAANVPLLISVSDLLTNATDVYGNSITLVGVGTDGLNLLSTNGVTLLNNAIYILYTNSMTPNVNDSFNYTVSDGQGGTNVGTVFVVLNNNNLTGQSNARLDLSSTNVTANFFGLPGYRYTVDRSTNLVQGLGWVPISTNTAPANGVIQITDGFQDLGIPIPPLPASAFYRLRYNP